MVVMEGGYKRMEKAKEDKDQGQGKGIRCPLWTQCSTLGFYFRGTISSSVTDP